IHTKTVPVQRISAECPLQGSEDIPCADTEKSFLNLPSKSLLTPPTPLFGYPHHIHHVLQNDQLDSRPNVISPCSSLYSSNFRRQRGEKKPIPDEQKDEKYFERRRRNNQAAKKSRDARKMREDQIALRATILEHENAILRAQVLTLREETSSLRQMLLQKKALEIASRDTQICGS
ncbi:transcription factor atf1, partial [Asbolus verrucosus]